MVGFKRMVEDMWDSLRKRNLVDVVSKIGDELQEIMGGFCMPRRN
jgi:hypothetical protein